MVLIIKLMFYTWIGLATLIFLKYAPFLLLKKLNSGGTFFSLYEMVGHYSHFIDGELRLGANSKSISGIPQS